MKYHVVRFQNLELALKELEPFVKNPAYLQTGKPFKKFGDMRPREMLANWLLCALLNDIDGRKLTFCSDPIGGDGIIFDELTQKTWATEHVYVPKRMANKLINVERLIFEAIETKQNKGFASYASGKTLIVFVDTGPSEWFPNRIARNLPDPLYFEAVWVISLQSVENGDYVYGVTLLDISQDPAPVYLIRIGSKFDGWAVTELQ
jgi:hypothetical protein